MIYRYYLIFWLTLLSVSIAEAGGGWTQPKQSGYFKLGQNMILASAYYQPDGTIIDITTIGLYTSSAYLEYGITDRVTTIAYLPFFVRNTLNRTTFTSGRDPIAGDFVNAIGDADVSFKYGIVRDKPFVVSASLTFGLPLGETSGGRTRILQTGDGEFNQMFTLEVSRSFHPVPVYVTTLLSFNNRTKDFSDEFRYGLELGYTLANKWIMQIRFYGVESFYNGQAAGGGGNSIFANNTEYLAITPEVAFKVQDHIGISANAGFAAFGKKILATPNYGLGVFFTF